MMNTIPTILILLLYLLLMYLKNEKTRIPAAFLSQACKILGDTNAGLTGSEIVTYCVDFADRFNIDIPYSEYPFFDSPNKRTALLKNLQAFTPEQQYIIIKELCELDKWSDDPKIKDLKIKLISRYGSMFQGSECINEILIEETKHWLDGFKKSKQNYLNALEKFNNGVYLRNSLDDLRLSLELLLQEIFKNSKSLENQIPEVGSMVTSKGGSKEFTSMFKKLVEYYTKYQNTYIKHDDRVMELEIEFIFELTSSFMKHFVRLSER